MQEEEVDKGSDSGDMQMDTGALMLGMAVWLALANGLGAETGLGQRIRTQHVSVHLCVFFVCVLGASQVAQR